MAVTFSSAWPVKGHQALKNSNPDFISKTDSASSETDSSSDDIVADIWSPEMPKKMGIYWADFDYLVHADHTSKSDKMRNLYQTMEKVYEFFRKNFGLYAINSEGDLPLFFLGWERSSSSWVFSGEEENKCLWSFNSNCEPSLEGVAHECMHTIITRRHPLPYSGMTAELIEAICDVIAIACKHWLTYPNKPIDWRIENLRDLSKYVDVRDFRNSEEYVNHNSRIISYAFYLAVRELNDVSYGTIAKIWWQAFLEADYRETYSSFASRTMMQAKIYDSKVQDAIKKSWLTVKIFESRPLRATQQDRTVSRSDQKTDRGKLRATEISNFPYQPPFTPKLWGKAPYNEFP